MEVERGRCLFVGVMLSYFYDLFLRAIYFPRGPVGDVILAVPQRPPPARFRLKLSQHHSCFRGRGDGSAAGDVGVPGFKGRLLCDLQQKMRALGRTTWMP